MLWPRGEGLEDHDGILVENEASLKEMGKDFFANIYKDEGSTSLDQQLKVISLFPRFIPSEQSSLLSKPVSLHEIELALKAFKKDRSPGPDGWPVEFYLHFFDLLSPILLKVIDQTRVSGFVPPSLNSTFLALIPKKDKPRTFADFRPISLCNLLYKLIAKIIAGRLKPFLDLGISREQFVFLKDRQISEPIGIVQEVLHSIKTKNLCAFILKLDLTKAFDRVDWSYVRLILIQIGIPLLTVNWIMACITSVNFAVLVNGTPSPFFTASRGIRQGYPLSPLLFILVIEGFSLLIRDARNNGLIRGIQISPSLALSHLLFVDDVILMGSGTLLDWSSFEVILETFSKASGMKINVEKSCLLYCNMDNAVQNSFASSMPYRMLPLHSGFTYLGYFLKPLGYRVNDWIWLLQKFEKRISNWTFQYLSLGGRLVLVQSILSSTTTFRCKMRQLLPTARGFFLFNLPKITKFNFFF